jgi:hypothetical protein
MDDSDTQANLGQFSDTDDDAVQINEAPDHSDVIDFGEPVTFPAEDPEAVMAAKAAEADTDGEEPMITEAAAETLNDPNEMLDAVEECMDGDTAEADDCMGEEFVAGFESQPAPNDEDALDRADLVAFDALVERVDQTISKPRNA